MSREVRRVPNDRTARQAAVHAWCAAAFGPPHAASVETRALRLVEEAIEAAQAANCDPYTLHLLVNRVYARPVGELSQELGGVGVTLLALAHAHGVDADYCERFEFDRVLSKPLAHFAAREAAKAADGFGAAAPRTAG